MLFIPIQYLSHSNVNNENKKRKTMMRDKRRKGRKKYKRKITKNDSQRGKIEKQSSE